MLESVFEGVLFTSSVASVCDVGVSFNFLFLNDFDFGLVMVSARSALLNRLMYCNSVV